MIQQLIAMSISDDYPRSVQVFRHRDYYELQVAFVWEDILGTRDIFIRDDFFELGGDLEGAESLLATLKADFGADVSVARFAETPTVEALAGRVRAVARTRGPKPTTARMQGRAPAAAPLVIVHDVRGDVLDLQQIRGADIGRPVIGVRAPGVDLEDEPLHTLDAMADRYVTDLLKIGVREPFLLAGNSNGALIAYDMALRLEAIGEKVAYLGLFEPPPADGTGSMTDMSESIDRFIAEMCAMHDIEYRPDRVDDCFDALKEVDQIPHDYSSELIMRTLELNAINLQACGLYRVSGRFGGNAVLYESRASKGKGEPIGRLSECEFTGSSYECFWSHHLSGDTAVRRQPCSHRALWHRRETKLFLIEDIANALSD